MSDVTATDAPCPPRDERARARDGPVRRLRGHVLRRVLRGVLHHQGQRTRLAAGGHAAPEDRHRDSILTVILIISSVTVQLSLRSIRSGSRSRSIPVARDHDRAGDRVPGAAALRLLAARLRAEGRGVRHALLRDDGDPHGPRDRRRRVPGRRVRSAAAGSAVEHAPRSARRRRDLLGLRRRRLDPACSPPSTC